MKNTPLTKLGRALITGFCIATVYLPPASRACLGSAGEVCVINPAACLKSMVLAKAAPAVVVLAPGASAFFSLPMNLFITCPATNQCGTTCANPGGGAPLTPASIAVRLYPGPCPPGAVFPPPTVTATISTAAGTMAAPLCSSSGTFNAYSVPVAVPVGTPPGLYCVVGTASVTFPDGTVLTQTGDTVVCLVDPIPGRPGVPRLDLQLISPPIVRAAPGDKATATYRVINNDPSNSVQVLPFAKSHQSAVRPQGDNEAHGVFAISSPFGDDFPILFNPGTNCIPLPGHPYTQSELSGTPITIPPSGSNTITVGIRSYGQCANGSCSESTLRVTGTFSDNTTAQACAGMSLMVDAGIPSTACALAVNDCNHNGIPDALDIAARRSADRNFNSIPDECEQFIIAPYSSSVSPTNPLPGAPIYVQVGFNEVIPLSNVWANGSSLTRTQIFSSPIWVGTIPADTRPGPQTVYFLGKDQSGGLASYIAVYNVQTPPPSAPFIISVIPDRAVAGDTIRITGRGFGNNPDNLCTMIASQNLTGGGAQLRGYLRVLTATDDLITARVGPIPPPIPNAPPAKVIVQLGEGHAGPITPTFPQILGGQDTWVWTSRETSAVAPSNFIPTYIAPPAGRDYFYGSVSNGMLCVYVSGNWPTNAAVTLATHFVAGGVEYDLQESTVTFAGGGTALDCAVLLRDLLVSAFGQQGGLPLGVDVVEVSPGVVKLTIHSPNNQPITGGSLVICRSAPPPPPNRHWLPLLGNSAPGTPGTMSVLGTSPSNTTLQVSIPGVWLTTEIYGDRQFTRVELPAVRLGGLGFPTSPNQRGWYDFPAETGYPPLPPDPYLNGLDLDVPVPDFPESALGYHSTNEREMLALGIDPAGARPGVPCVRGFVAVSRASGPNDVGVQINAQDFVNLPLTDPLRPAGFDSPDSTARPGGYSAPQLVDEEFYATFQGFYQGNETAVSPISRAGVFATAEIRLPLLRVLSPNLVQLATNYILQVKHLKGTEDFTCPIPWDSWIFKFPFINGQALRDALTAKGISIQASRSAHYLILTPSVYRPDLNEFAFWKKSKGLNVDFAYVGTAPGDDVAPTRAAIDAYLENYFQANYCHGVYALIIGDVDVIESGRSTRVIETPDKADADSDHVYEVLGSDRFPSLYVGRLSINNSAELQNQLRKILSYERSPVAGDWPTRATLAANSQTDSKCYGVCAEFPSKYAKAVEDIVSYGGYSAPPTFQKLHAGAASMAVTRAINQDVVDAVNARRGQVLYRGHGSGSAWVSGWDGSGTGSGSDFTQGTHIPLLTNTAYPIVFSIACENARLRNMESLGESWMLSSNGAVAHFGASVDSKTTENHERAKGIYRAIYESGFTRLAPALGEAERISYNVTGGGTGWDNNTFAYNLLGDPELTIRRKGIINGRLLGASSQFGGGSRVTVLGLANAPVALTLVNVHLSSGGPVNGFTGADGTLVLSNIPSSMVVGFDLHADGYASEVAPIRPLLRAISYSPLGFVLRVEGSPGTYQILRSTDLSTWPNAGVVTIPANASFADFTDPTVSQRTRTFYRAVGSP